MNLLYANPLSLVYHYLSLFIYGTPLDQLSETFHKADFTHADFSSARKLPPIGSRSQPETFDFIVVGSGPGGSTVASRLTEENFTVLLLEAGGDPFPLTSVPSLSMNMVTLKNSPLDWRHMTVPQQNACLGSAGNRARWNSGKVLGGSSVLNFMVYMRGNPWDWDNLASETNDTHWSYKRMLKYFKRIENYHGQFSPKVVHGTRGPLHVSGVPYATGRAEFLKAGVDLGYQVKDPNGATPSESFFPLELTIKNGTRMSALRAYLYPAILRENLEVRIYSHVTKVQLNAQNRAIGVHYEQKGKKFYAAARNEVILSAGVIGSPQILMLSGIGPRDHLNSIGIKTKVHLPAVGQNLQDHLFTWAGPILIKNFTQLENPPRRPTRTLNDYIEYGRGPFSTTGVAAGALLKSSKNLTSPDLFLQHVAIMQSQGWSNLFSDAFNFKRDISLKYMQPNFGQLGLHFIMALAKPKSVGNLKLRNSDPYEQPIINPNYLSHPHDLDVMVKGVQFLHRLANERIGSSLHAK